MASRLLANPNSSSKRPRNSVAMKPRSISLKAPLPAATTVVFTSCSSVVTLDSVPSTALSELLAYWRLTPYWVLSDCDCETSSARAAATGSSDGGRMRRPEAICCCVLTRPDCSSPSWAAPDSNRVRVLMRMMFVFLLSAERKQHVEHLAGNLHDLAGRLVGLLVTQQVGRLFVEVDARFGLQREARPRQEVSRRTARHR